MVTELIQKMIFKCVTFSQHAKRHIVTDLHYLLRFPVAQKVLRLQVWIFSSPFPSRCCFWTDCQFF